MSDTGGPGNAGDDPILTAFRRLLVDAAAGGQSKVDALVALSQRTVWVATWPGGGEGYRTLTNSSGSAALPIFTTESMLEEAARRYGWMNPDGSIPSREVGARDALRHAIAHNLQFVVVDIGEPHSLEVERAGLEPLLSRRSRSGDSGPYAGTGRLSSELIQAVRPTPPPGSIPAATGGTPRSGSGVVRFTPSPGSIPAVPRRATPSQPIVLPEARPEVRQPPATRGPSSPGGTASA